MRVVKAADPHAAHALPSHPTDVLQGHEGAVLCVAFNASGAYALTGGMVKKRRFDPIERKKLDLFSFFLRFLCFVFCWCWCMNMHVDRP